ncbi:glycosyltransferase family 2 protein [Prevotella sp. E15-22]|uniref:glycosyltransferase family 2 protein n=1 Tax=Prevotella sp. E15-22 TaxID=2937774 RepID=UPI0020638A30|nr:glycosyltransferase family 2 protein [Prevotella sp. E15-22]UPS43595.1 glycosyltransferase family 2 protein [Prevotella sp. E15-22]
MPKVSVILPVYNVAPYLDEALKSLENQTLKDIEIIAVNDGSTDNSEEILKKHQETDQRIRYFNQENRGQSAARNLAMKYAKGEYIYFMDSDDVIDIEALQICYNHAKTTNADFIFFDGETMLDEGAQPLSWDYKRTNLVSDDRQDGLKLLNRMLDKEKHNCVVWVLFIKHEYLRNIQLSFYPGIIHEDELFTTLLTLQSSNIFALKKSFVKHRVRKASTMGKHYSKYNLNCYLTVIDELFRFQDSPIIRKFARYTLSKVFYTGHVIPLSEKFGVFWRAIKSGYLRYIGWKATMVFWLKR